MRAALTLRFANTSLRTAGTVIAGTAVLALSSYIQVPMVPVPMTMQTLAVTLMGAFLGIRLGTATVLAWLIEAAAGLPVLAGGAAGLAPFVGPTAGFLYVFPLAAALTGRLGERGWNRRIDLAFLSLLLGNALCLAGGMAWLAPILGAGPAFAVAVVPFAAGGAVKAAIGAVFLRLKTR